MSNNIEKVYYSYFEQLYYTETEINTMIENSDTLTSDNGEKEYQNIIDNLDLQEIN